MAESLINIATVEFRHGRHAQVATLARDGLTISEESAVPRLAAYAFDNLRDIAQAQGSQ